MEELSDELYHSIMDDLERGDQLAEQEQFKTAINLYRTGLDKLPHPQTGWEISLHLYTALGDCYFNLGDYELSNDSYNKALQCPNALDNGYVWLGLGQSYFELENIEKAEDALMSAYMLEGEEIFEEEDDKYFELIKPYLKENNIPKQNNEPDIPQDDPPRPENRPPGTSFSLLNDKA